MPTEADIAAFLEHIRTRAQRLKNPSQRTPDRETDHNYADNIERQLQEDGHTVWGWVIYRCTYNSDSEWAEFMSRLRYYVEATLQLHNALDMLSSLDYRVIEDREQFDGAHPSVVREHHAQWAETAVVEEQGEGKRRLRSQRYGFCIHVDQAAVQSVISGPPPPEDELGGGFVNLVRSTNFGGLRPEHSSVLEERDHHWMRISYASLMSVWYNLFRVQGMWRTVFTIPPEVARP